MSRKFNILSIKFQDKQYAEGFLEIDEDINQVQVLQHRKKWYSESWETVTKLTYTPKTVMDIQTTKISVGDLSFSAANEQDAATIAGLIGKPRVEERTRIRKDVLTQFQESARHFLLLRAEALAVTSNLRKSPRQTVIESAHLLSEDTSDPIDELLEMYLRRLRDGLSGLDAVSKHITEEVKGEWSEKLYALIYGIGTIQDAIFNNDQATQEKGLNFMSNLCAKKLEGLEGLSATEVTSSLLEEAFKYISQLIELN